MTARHIWTVICSNSVIDKDTNNVSLFDVLEQIQLDMVVTPEDAVAVLPFPLNIVSLWSREQPDNPTQVHAKDRVLSPTGQILFEGEYDIDISEYQRTRYKRRLFGLQVPESGEYNLVTQFKASKRSTWREVCRIPLQIELKRK